jgi:hypothetical protein
LSARHISLLELAAYHLGTAPVEELRRIEAHLSEPCAECRASNEFVSQVAAVMQRDRQATPPEAVVKRARAIFHRLPAEVSSPASVVEGIAELIFDSFLAPAMAGARSAFSLNRHLVFRHWDLVLDMVVEPESTAERQAITGQVQSRNLEPKQLEGLPVMLMDGDKVLMSTRTTALGEFLFRDAPCRQLSLSLVSPDCTVRVPGIPPATG